MICLRTCLDFKGSTVILLLKGVQDCMAENENYQKIVPKIDWGVDYSILKTKTILTI